MERAPAVAGLFYPNEREELEKMLDDLLERANPPVLSSIGVVSPHAGYIYSGLTAAHAFKSYWELPRSKVVVIVGPSHYEPFVGFTLSKADWWTPLGLVENWDDYGDFDDFGPVFMEKAFAREHSIEVQLPFIQRLNDDFRFVPILTGFMGKAEVEMLAAFIKRWVEKYDAAVVISSDFTHYEDVMTADYLDSQAFDMIRNYQWENLIMDTRFSICGLRGIAAMVKLAQEKKAVPTLVHYTDSSAVNGDTSSVVTYAAWNFKRE